MPDSAESGSVSSLIWEPVAPLTEAELNIDLPEFDSMFSVWLDSRARLEEENAESLSDFYERLRRSWSIETGILENLYVLDRGTTQTLIDRGFHHELINRADTDTDPARLVAVLKDHLLAGEMLQSLIAEERPLSPHFVRELHALLTRNQDSVEALDTLGRSVRVEPLRGTWKTHDNSREMEDGTRKLYCPPEQVAGQVDDLLTYLSWYNTEPVSICVLAAWLHQRFTYIHPFQDGNGRVARALVNYLFIRANLFPVVIDRDDKVEYIEALSEGDDGDLRSLASLFAQRQIDAIKQALSLTADQTTPVAPMVTELARGIADRVRRRREKEQIEFREVNIVMDELWTLSRENIRKQLEDFMVELQRGGVVTSTDVDAGGTPDGREHYYRWQIVESAQQAHQWANFNEQALWVRALIRGGTSQLRFILSFHHVGRTLTGVAEVTSIADLEDLKADPDNPATDSLRTPVHCMVQPFSITWRDDPIALQQRFEDWFTQSLVIALRVWSDTL